MAIDEQTFKRNLILSHYEEPQFKVETFEDKEHLYHVGKKDSPSCIDNITAYAKISNDIIKDVRFSGVGCVICTASTDLMCLYINNKKTSAAKKIIANYLNMIDNKPYDKKLLEDLIVFSNINKQLNRIRCAKVGIEAIYEAIK
ncbi:MAG: iron-sulfur cluster assembly scaffold protein [Mycoplasmataceae bacterium]|jgi:nitrogen fixation NifU-like protein|nr:iron-sulfur cluster assembly scaffold protein [Mycoplasmataceae bacterium]